MQAFLPPTPVRLSNHQRHNTHIRTLARSVRRPPNSRLNSTNQDIGAAESSALTAAAATFILKRAAETYQHGGPKPRAFTVLEALLQLEATQKKHGHKANMEKLLGQWRLIFTGDPRKRFQTMYFPIRAHQTFRNSEFDNGIFLFGGGLSLRFIGPMRFGKRNRMEFCVDRVKVKIGGFEWGKDGLDPLGDSLEGRKVKDLPFFTFFLLRDDLAAARGRSGGLALYAKVPDDQQL